jgi:hypothetical protein
MSKFGPETKKGLGSAEGLFRAAGKNSGKIFTDAATAAAKGKVEDLTKKVASAAGVQADAAGKLRVAEAKLAEVRANSKSKASQIAAAEEAVAAAMRKSASATDAAKKAASSLSDAQSKVAQSADQVGAKTGNRFTQSFSKLFKPKEAVEGKLKKVDGDGAGKQVASRFGVGFSGVFGGIASKSAGLFVAGFAAIKSAQVFGSFINDARESAKVARVSEAVIKSTGGVAGITAKSMGDLATAISNKTGADDEAIQSGENLLATFTNVRNGVGKGSDVFTRATAAAVDMASAMNNGVVDANGLKAANIQLGKALNDPVKGVTALSKVGVSFTAQQKEQIKTLVASGNTLGAQKIILGEVGKEFGGAAAAAADPLSRLQTITGNLAEKVGGFLLPTVDKFATFLGDKAIPTIGGLADKIGAYLGPKLKEFGGFLQAEVLPRLKDFGGFIQTEVLPRLQDFGGFVQTEILPKLKEFGGFLVDNVVPAVQNLIAAFTPLAKDVGAAVVSVFEKLAPVVMSLGTSIVGTVLPAIKDFTGWLKDNSTLVGAVAIGVGAMVVAFQAYQLTLTIVGAATKAYAAVQAALNLVMSLNPIGIVLLALVGLAAGLVYAYKKSETFRDIVNAVFGKVRDIAVGVFSAVVGAVKTAIDWVKSNWPLLLGILTGPFGLAVILIARNWDAIKTAAQSALRFVVNKVLEFAGNILNAAAKAFGWVPGLGDKLKGAKTEFQKFRNSVNTSLGGINDQTIQITPIVLAAQQARRTSVDKRLGNRPIGLAAGGGVFGGERGKDSVPALLMPDEHVWTTRETAAVGGHGPMKRLRQAALAGELRGFAAGGGVTVKTKFPPTDAFAANVTRVAVAVAKPMAQTLGNQFAASLASMGPSGPPGSVHTFRGKKLNTRTIGMLLNAEKILGAAFHITQGSYSTSVAASGGTHSGGGAMDTNGPRGWGLAQSALRRAGFAAWHRTPAQGPWGHHIHSIAIGDSSASPSAKRQVQSYLRGGNGLGGGIGNKSSASQRASVQSRLDRLGVNGMAMGGPVGKFAKSLLFDNAGYLPTGKSVVDNQTGKPEPLTRTDQAMNLTPEAARLVGKEVGKAISDATFRLTQSGTNGSYLLQMSNG